MTAKPFKVGDKVKHSYRELMGWFNQKLHGETND